VAQSEALLKATQAQDANIGVLRAQYEHAIGVLVGEPASTFGIPAELIRVSLPPIPLALPSGLLQRRPDIAAAERTVAQANAQIGLAQTAFFPAVTLSAAAGFESISLTKWLDWPSRVWSVGPALAQTIFDGGLRRATVQQFRSAYDQTVANYRETVLTAFQQVEDSLAAVRILDQVIEQQDAAIETAERNVEEAKVRYQAGLDPYLNVIAAQTAFLNLQQTEVSFRAQQLVAAVQLIEALGGGWDASQMPSAKELERRIPHASNSGN
jgi:NodT family efflux transporter outer membrane factor (OMF) lipoprotein